MDKVLQLFKINIKQFGAEALWVASGQIVSVAVLFAGVRLMTQVMSPFEYGKLAIIMSIVNGALYSFGQALKMAATRYFSVMADDKNPNWYWDFFLKIIRNSAILFAAAAFLCLLAGPGFGRSFTQGAGWAMAVVLAFIVLVNAVAHGIQNGARNRKIFVLHQVLFDAVRVGFAFIIAVSLSGSALNALSGFVIGGCMVAVSQLFFLLKLKKSFYLKNFITSSSTYSDRSKKLYSYTWPLLAGGVLGWIQIFSDRWALKSMASYDDVGIYFALYQTMYSFWIYATIMLGNFLGTILFSKVKDGSDHSAYIKMLKLNEYICAGYLVLVLLCFLLLLPAKLWLCSLLFASEYGPAAALIPWVALSGGMYGIGQQLLYSIYGGMSSRSIIPVKAKSAAAGLILYFSGAFFWGVEGVVFGGLIFSFFYMTAAFNSHLKEKKKKGYI